MCGCSPHIPVLAPRGCFFQYTHECNECRPEHFLGSKIYFRSKIQDQNDPDDLIVEWIFRGYLMVGNVHCWLKGF